MRADVVVIMVMVMCVVVVVPMVIMLVVMRVPVGMISVIIVPVIRVPGIPVIRVVTPIPCRAPEYISGMEDELHHRPGGDVIVRGCDNRPIIPGAQVSRIGCFGVIRFNDIIPSVQCLVTDQLYPYFPVFQFFYDEYGHILTFVARKCGS